MAALLAACAAEPAAKRPRLGELPSATTTAEPDWIPFRIRAGKAVDADPRERRLGELRQLTFDGSSTAPAWSPDGRRLLFESTRGEALCGQIFEMDLASGRSERVSPERGWATSGCLGGPETGRLFFALAAGDDLRCSPIAQRVRPASIAFPQLDIYFVPRPAPGGGAGEPRPFIAAPGYDAELACAADGTLVFTSTRDGDPELYAASAQGGEPRRLTREPGYDGGAALSPDAARLVWHAERRSPPAPGAAASAKGDPATELRLSALRIMLAGTQGQHPRAVVDDGRLNFAPAFLPDGRRIGFASDRDDSPAQPERNVELYVIDPDGPLTATGTAAVERVTYHVGFDGAARWSPDGQYVAFVSSRFARAAGEINLFVARWLDLE